MNFLTRLQHGWDAFKNADQIVTVPYYQGPSSSIRPDRTTFRGGNERSIVTAIYSRIAVDCAAATFQHVRVDENGRFSEVIKSGLNECLTTSANLDQTGRNLIQDIVMSLCDEGVVAVVPTRADVNPELGSYNIEELRVGRIMQWFPAYVQVQVYNEDKGIKQDIYVNKKACAIIENPLYAVMNEPSSTLRRLIWKLNMLDKLDEQTSSGKLDLIIQLPYIVKTPQRREQAEQRRKDIEAQLTGSKYGIAYTDGTEHITQLNRPVENNLLAQIDTLTKQLYSQLGISEEILNGTASEEAQLAFESKTTGPMLTAIADEFKRKFLTKTARTQGQSIMFFKDPFKLVPVSQIADIADKMTRNEILSPNEVRVIIGYKPDKDPKSDELRNRNINQSDAEQKSSEEKPEEDESLQELREELTSKVKEEQKSKRETTPAAKK